MCNNDSIHLKFMKKAFECAEQNSSLDFQEGGPFGAVVVQNENIIGSGRNKVLVNHDPTAHAEIQAIRNACINLGSHDLSGCIMYTSCFPCPMCLSAIMWANISIVYYGNTRKDADKIGFRDDAFYIALNNIINNKPVKDFKLLQIGNELTIKTFEKFLNQNRS
ncbi:MAG: nucleoside deaminase [Clostridia bacterium]|nr:nucleoside deaminase [Clostridia bacterium]